MIRAHTILVVGLTATVLAISARAGMADEIKADGLDRLPSAQIVILGERHDNAMHHVNQARAVRALQPKAIVMEMLSPAQVASAQGTDRRDADRLEAALHWDGSGWPDFADYAPILAAAPEAELYGAEVPIGEVRQAVQDGAAGVFGKDAALYGLTLPLAADTQALREAAQKSAHCGLLPDRMLSGMVSAQRLRDASFARVALRALAETGGPVAVITGNGHADRFEGMPVYLAAAAPDVSVLSVGQVEATTKDAPFDLWVVTTPAVRSDPCADFKVLEFPGVLPEGRTPGDGAGQN